jgi:lysophospholipase L1-like esterase
MAADARHAGIVPIFVTAPSNHVAGHEPAYLALRHLRTLSELVPLHTAYLDATRSVARETGTPLCDASAAFAALPPPHDRYFMKDGIHLTADGDQEMATVLAACIQSAAKSIQ